MRIYFQKASIFFLCGLVSTILTAPVSGQNMFRKMMDFDGDGKADFAVTRGVGGAKYWYIWQSTNGFRVTQFGFTTDENAPGDFDVDGKFDVAVFRQEPAGPGSTTYSFWIFGSQVGVLSYVSRTNAYPNVVAHQQDYDGDGSTDISWTIENNARIFVVFSQNGSTIPYNNPGGTFIKIGDMTGDGKADVAASDSSNIVRIRNSGSGTTQAVPFGAPGDVYVPADFDGDGKTDLAIWRSGPQSYYWVYGSQIGAFALAWGTSGDSVARY